MADGRQIGFGNCTVRAMMVDKHLGDFHVERSTEYLEVRNAANTALQTGPQGR